MIKSLQAAPGQSIVALTKHDTTDFAPRPRGILLALSGSGNVVFINDDDTLTTIPDTELALGVVLPMSPKRINATDSTFNGVIYGIY